MKPLSVTSEIGRLRSVMIHLPGEEIDRMLPSMMVDLLFEDILFGDRAREEHRRMQRVIAYVAEEVLEVGDLLVEVLRNQDSRAAVLDDIGQRLGLAPDVMELLRDDPPEELAAHLIGGIVRPGVDKLPENADELYLLPPIPNLFFQRDPAIAIGDRVAISAMATGARLREPLLASYVFGHHPRFRRPDGSSPVLFHRWAPPQHIQSRANPRPMLEGGDVLVVREDLLVIGHSQRTGRHTIERLAEVLRAEQSPVRSMIVVELPKQRSFMHLDTVFTIISEGECLIHEPAILPGEVQEVGVYQLDLSGREVTISAKGSLLEALAGAGIDLRPIPCGGPDDPISQQREQWTDGANAFALAPGVIVCYERNVKTAEQLDSAGYEIIMEDDLLLGRSELDLDSGQRYAIQLQGHELPRARGGPRCLTMPIHRDPL